MRFFFHSGGQPRNVLEVYELLVEKHIGLNNQAGDAIRPERTLASHVHASGNEKVIASRYLQQNNDNAGQTVGEGAFLSGHFDAVVSSFAPVKKQATDIFEAPLEGSGIKRNFFFPQRNTDNLFSNGVAEQFSATQVLSSRYGRAAPLPGDREGIQTLTRREESNIPVPKAAPNKNQEVTLYPSIFNEGKTVVITSSEYGKTDLPLDLSHYRKETLEQSK